MSPKIHLNILFFLGIIFFTLEFIGYCHKYIENPQNKYIFLSVFSFFCIASFFIFTQLNIKIKKNINLLIISLIFATLTTEKFLGYVYGEESRGNLYKSFSIKPDQRLPIEVLKEGKLSGKNIYGIPRRILKMTIGSKDIIPLNAAANVETLFCNDQGPYISYLSDEYGFNNPQGSWRNFSNLDIVFIGDSFTQGICVERKNNFVELTRKNFPNLLNLGFMNTGPLIQLATIKEYLPPKIQYVFWSYFEGNDIHDLANEKKERILLGYLNNNYDQNLMVQQANINKNYLEYLDKKYFSDLENFYKQALWSNKIIQHIQNPSLLLPNINRLIDRAFSQQNKFEDLDLLKEVYQRGKKEVENRGGKLVIIYLPEYYRFRNQHGTASKLKNNIIKIARSLGIDIIDIDKTFLDHEDPLEFFPFRANGHYNEKGYKLIATEIISYINSKKTN